jgi:uncharacterized protein DUF4232
VRGRLVVGLLLLAVVAAGCSSSSKKTRSSAPAGPAVPWTSSQPSQVVERTPAARACRAADLAIRGQVAFLPRVRGGIALVTLWNASSSACRLTGRPRVRFVKTGGPRQKQMAIPTTPSNFPEVAYPKSSLLALRPGEPAALTVIWDNWCDPLVPGKPHVPPSAMRITLPAGHGSIDADYNAVPQCLDPTKASTIGVSTFQPNLIRLRPHPWTSAFIRGSIPGQPVRARRGGTLHFRVVLTNASKAPAGFGHCPAYVQQLVPSGKVEVYDLNCDAAHAIRHGTSLAFAMQIRVPKDAPLGNNGLFWELDPFGTQMPSLHARVRITR